MSIFKRGAFGRCTCTKDQDEKWRLKCHASLNQKDYKGFCESFAVAHAIATEPNAKRDVTEATAYAIQRRAHKLIGQDRPLHDVTLYACLVAAREMGLIDRYYDVLTFDGYLVSIPHHPVVLATTMFPGMEREYNGWIGVDSKKKTIGKHVFCSLGHKPGWWNGNYSIIKNSWGRDWGRNGECLMGDRDMRWLFEQGHMQGFAVVK